ncbi:MAG: hypothetical protein JSW45_12200 [Thiotrichales bacterium]|nr:MAG: hypothetical protein JSW45_12200 [Thiotrichales bacterium]
MKIRFAHLLLALSLTVLLAGCDKFVKQESENLAPFAEQTLDLIGSIEYSLDDADYLYLRDIEGYIDAEDPFGRYLKLENQAGNMLIAVVAYSMQIVSISEQNVTDNEKANRLADVILELVDLVREDEVVVNPNRDDENTKAVIARVRQSQDYLEALRLLLPLINEFSAHAGRVLDQLLIEKNKVALLTDAAIDKKYGAVKELHHEMRTAKDDMFRTLINLSQYSVTRDPAYLEKMKSYGMFSVMAATENRKSLSTSELAQLHKAITEELRLVNENYEQMKPDVEEYLQSHRELRKIVESKEDAISEARLTFVVWSRAYQKMASGKEDPAEWFDVSDSGKLLFGVAKKAAGI